MILPQPSTTKPSTLFLILSWVISLLLPIVLSLGAVRLMLFPWYVEFEYRTPNFPQDPYGFDLPPEIKPFSMADRLRYAHNAVEYLVNNADISFLGDLRFPEGQEAPPFSCQFETDCTRLYNDRELKHMVDVKVTVQRALSVFYLTLALLLILGVWAWLGKWWGAYRQGLSHGGWLTTILVGTIIGGVLVAFGVIFVAFHQIFFESGTWTFYFSDTLIRLFPERFWRDTFIMVGSLAAGMGLAFGYFFKGSRKV